jgi:Protein-disulfide isomerase
MDRLSRRAALATGAGAAASIAGCLGLGSGSAADPDELDSATRPTLGPSDASVRVVAFEDFSCPGCRAFQTSIFPALSSRYIQQGAVEYYHADYPIPVDEWSYPVASAARAVFEEAGDEAFFEFAAEMYGRSGSYSLDLIETAAESAGGIGGAARTAAADETYREAVDADRSLGSDWGVEGTPSVFVEDESVDPAELLDVLTDRV